MCYGNPTKSLEIARSRMTPEAWAKFEREFDDWCITSGLEGWMYQGSDARAWMKWAFFSARPVEDQLVQLLRNVCFYADSVCGMLRQGGWPGKAEALESRIKAVIDYDAASPQPAASPTPTTRRSPSPR